MGKWTRRRFLGKSLAAAAGGTVALGSSCISSHEGTAETPIAERISLDGAWEFRLDPTGQGESLGWAKPGASGEGWEKIIVPHTWQASEKTASYMGAAWYRRQLDAPLSWRGHVVRLEFEAVFHTARVWVNGREAGDHVGKGYTAFTVDVTAHLDLGKVNVIAVRADNSFSPAMLPRGNSYDWAQDGGMTRPVNVLVTGPVYLESLWIDAVPDPDMTFASLAVRTVVCNALKEEITVGIGYRITDQSTGLIATENQSALEVPVPSGASREIEIPEARLEKPNLWHFDHPHLYLLEAWVTRKGAPIHSLRTTFGVRAIEVRGQKFFLNGEPVRLMGVERMAGSNPAFGMAEPAPWIDHDHDDLKNLNCVFTRVHWPQDKRVLDDCDRKGILIQLEVPSWGSDTFKGMNGKPSDEIMANGLEQLGEMIRRDRNHPCVFSWGLCNEVNGQDPAAQEFVRRMLKEAKRLDPRRLCSYASNSLQVTPERDVAGAMDFIEWNEYYETWYGGTPMDMRRNLEMIHHAFPDKPVVISEYGYCACTSDRPENDERRAAILAGHNRVFRDFPWVGGLIFFDYNDYRTHLGDKGLGVLKQRVHGVVDVLGAR